MQHYVMDQIRRNPAILKSDHHAGKFRNWFEHTQDFINFHVLHVPKGPYFKNNDRSYFP